MPLTKAQILLQLQKEILPLQGFKPALHSAELDTGLGHICQAFPNATFPLGALHEFICDTEEAAAATCGFMAALVSNLMQNEGMALWMPGERTIYPPALQAFGISPERVIFLDVRHQKDILWAMEEALRCNGLAVVIGEIPHLTFTASRRLQLAVEQSKVTGFITRYKAKTPSTTATHTRWKITPLPSAPMDGLPGVSFPRWEVQLLKVRNGKPGTWQLEWVNGAFRHIETIRTLTTEDQKKTA